jgi:pimeloyl-ACP methyl ester carboxylesterase
MSAATRVAGVVLAVGVFLAGGPASAFDSACTEQDLNEDGVVDGDDWSGIVYKQVIYESATTSPSDLRANSSGLVRLRGWLYYKTGDVANAPVIVYNHGHNKGREEPCAIARFFVNHGFVVFAPLRRGHEANTPDPRPGNWNKISSTGVHTDDFVQECRVTNCIDQVRCNFVPFCNEEHLEVDYMKRQIPDVRDQIQFIKAQPAVGTSGKLVDPDRIVILGHSYGGSLIVMANAATGGVNGHAVAVSVSGAELSWGDDDPFWEIYMRPAVADAQRPIYFLQPKNGRTLEPTRVLSAVAIDHLRRFQAAVFAKAPWDPDKDDPEWRQAHGTFILDLDQVRSWGPSVIDFLERNHQ